MGLASGLGAVLDTGGGIVRDLAVGKNPLPHIFHPEERTTGREVLEHHGLLGPNKPGFDLGDVAGFAADVGLDPTTYLTLGASAVGKAGKIAKAAGMLPKSRAARIGETMADVVARSSPKEKAALEIAAGGAKGQAHGANEIARMSQSGEKLGGLARLHIPFTEKQLVLGTGDKAQKIAKAMDTVGEKIRYTAPVRRAAALFSYPSRDVFSKEAQQARQAMTAAEPGIREAAHEHTLNAVRLLKDSGVPEEHINKFLDPLVEGLPLPAGHGLNPHQEAGIKAAADYMRGVKDDIFHAIQNEGWKIQEMPQDLIEHFPRYLSNRQGKKAGFLGLNKLFDTTMDSKLPRTEYLREVPRQSLNQMSTDPFVASRNRLAPDDAAAAAHVASKYGITEPKQADLIAKFMHEHGNMKRMFDDPLRDFAQYTHQGSKTFQAIKNAKDFVLKYQEPMQPGYVPTEAVMGRLGFNTSGIPKGMGLPQHLADDATRMIKGVQSGDALGPVMAAWDRLRQAWKTGHTSPWPGFHIRNWGQTGLWMQYVSGATDPSKVGPMAYVQPWLDAGNLFKGKEVKGANQIPGLQNLSPQDATKALANEVFTHDINTHTLMQDVAGVQKQNQGSLYSRVLQQIPGAEPKPFWKSIGKAGMEAGAHVGGTGPISKTASVLNTPVRAALGAGAEAGNRVEALNRTSMYIAFRRQGMAPAVAAQRVKEINVDYSRLTDFEKKGMRRAVPFYTFSRHMIPEVLRNLAEHPGGAPAQVMKASYRARQRAGFMPEYLGGGLAIPVGQEDESGHQRYLTQLDLPHEQLNIVETGPGGLKKTLMNLVGMSDPIPKTLMELATNRSFYQDRDLRELDPRIGRILTQMGVVEHPKKIPVVPEHVAMSLLPTGRAVTTLGQLMDARKGLGVKALNTLTGARLSDVDMARQQEIGARNLVQDLLRNEPGVQTYEDLYATNPEQLSPEGQKLMRLVRTMQGRATKRKRELEKQSLAAK